MEYHDTASQNIAYGALESDPLDDAIRAASRAAAAEDIILALPDGYETLLGKWLQRMILPAHWPGRMVPSVSGPT